MSEKAISLDNLAAFQAKADIVYQGALVSGTNIKTINSQSILGSGDINVIPSGVNYLTTAPTSDNTDGNLKFVVLSAEPLTKYNGYYYIIIEA